MADEEVMGSASPAPSDHKRKLDDLDSEPFEQPPVSADSNGNSETVADADGDVAPTGVSPEDPDVKRPRLDENPDGLVESTENGHQEETEEEPKEDLTEPSDVMKNAESEQDQEKTDEPLDAVNKESVSNEPDANAMELPSAENPEEPDKVDHQESGVEHHESGVEHQESGVEHQESGIEHQDPPSDVAPQGDLSSLKDPPSDVAPQGDLSSLKDQPTSADQPTSRRMEVPSNKVGVLIGKAGDTIRTLQYSSGARIQITRDAEADPNSATRPVELIGSIENINKAERLIKDVIAEADAGGSPSLVARGFSVHSSGGIGEQIQIQVPNDKVGVIIGKGGETIKNLQTRSGARIQLIPQHLPEGDQSKERTVRVTGDRKQIETAKEMIKEVMDQPIRSSTPSGGGNNQQQNFRPRGPGPNWGPRGHHPSQPPSGYNYPPRGPYPSQNPPYSSQGYGNYPPQQPPPKNNFGWEQRPPTNMQGPPEQTGYDYYSGQGSHMAAPPSQPPMHSHPPGSAMGPPSQVNYNYGQPQGPDYGQQPAPYTQTAPQGYGQGYGETRYDHQGPPAQHPYGGQQGTQPPSSYPQGTTTHPGYGQQDQYGKPLAYTMPPQQGPYAPPPYGQPRQQPYPASGGSVPPQAYPQYATAPASNDMYSATSGYSQQGGQPVSGYAQTGVQPQQGMAAPGYAQAGPTTGYGQYPSSQPGYSEQVAPSSAGYGYQGAPDPAYASGPGMAYGAPPAVQPAYSQPVPVQPGYDQSIPQAGGYVTPQPQPQLQPQPQAGYGQYDGSQMYAAHR